MVEEIRQLFTPQATAKGVAIAHRLEAVEQDFVIGDPTRLRQVLLNLVSQRR